MFGFAFTTTNAKTIDRVIACCDSLNQHAPYWDNDQPLAGLLASLDKGEDYVRGAAVRLVEAAVPEPGFPHPQQATADAVGGTAVFSTPGGVEVKLWRQPGDRPAYRVEVRFGRDSRWLAFEMLSAFISAEGRFDTYVDVLEEDGDFVSGVATEAGEVLAKHLSAVHASN